jgi:hypothetical protein
MPIYDQTPAHSLGIMGTANRIPEMGLSAKLRVTCARRPRANQKRFPGSIVTSGNACKAIVSSEWVCSV